MVELFYSLLGFIVAIGLLTAIHEYGHFWVARRVGIKVLRFSIGFGKKLFSWHDKRGTEYAVCALPLGGYVKMLDQNEGDVPANEVKHAFNTQPLWKRALVIIAGPLSNLLFAVFAYWLVFIWGTSTIVPIIGNVEINTPAYAAGLRQGQEIVAIDNSPTKTWEDVVLGIASHAGEQDNVTVAVKDHNSDVVTQHEVNLQNWTLDNEGHMLDDLGMPPYDPLLPIVGEVMPGYPAQVAGLKAGDVIVAINGDKIHSISQLLDTMRDKYNQSITLGVDRNGTIHNYDLIPTRKEVAKGEVTGFIGIQFEKQVFPDYMIRVQSYSPLTALGLAVDRTWDYSVLTLQFLGKMVMGKISLQHISGPISIAQYAGVTVRAGIENFISFLALISISLGVINLLPIPVLDGEHLLFCVIEAIRGKALSTRALNIGLACGIVILGGVMVLAIYNDVLRLLH